jgi:hypothetical protein
MTTMVAIIATIPVTVTVTTPAMTVMMAVIIVITEASTRTIIIRLRRVIICWCAIIDHWRCRVVIAYNWRWAIATYIQTKAK